MKRVLILAVLASGCWLEPEPRAHITLLRSTPELGTPMGDGPDVAILFDYEILPAGLKYGGVAKDSVSFNAYGQIYWADGSRGSSHRFFREPVVLPLGSETRGRAIPYVYAGGDLQAVISFARKPKLDEQGNVIPVDRVEMKAALNWGYGCRDTEPGGTDSCPGNLGHIETLGPIVF